MQGSNLIICCQEETYAVRLMEMLCFRPEIDAQMRIFTSWQDAAAFSETAEVDILLIDGRFSPECRQQIHALRRFLLVDSREEPAEGEIEIRRYQSSSQILSALVEGCLKDDGSKVFRRMRRQNGRLYCIYTPAEYPAKTDTALRLCRQLSSSGKTLYLNLEPFSGWSVYADSRAEQTLEDLIYYLRQDDKNLGLRAGMITVPYGNFACIPPMERARDILEVTREEWKHLLEQLLMDGGCEYVVIQPGNQIQGLMELLEDSDIVYVPFMDDSASLARLGQFEQYLADTGREELRNHLKRITCSGLAGQAVTSDYLQDTDTRLQRRCESDANAPGSRKKNNDRFAGTDTGRTGSV